MYSSQTCTYGVCGIRTTGQWVLHSDASGSRINTKEVRCRNHPEDSVLNVVLKDKIKIKSTRLSSRVELESHGTVMTSVIKYAQTKQTTDKLHRFTLALTKEPNINLHFKYI